MNSQPDQPVGDGEAAGTARPSAALPSTRSRPAAERHDLSELIVSACLVVVAFIMARGSMAFPDGLLKSGLWPFCGAVLLGCMALWGLVRSLVRLLARKGTRLQAGSDVDGCSGRTGRNIPRWARSAAMLLLLFGYVLLQRAIGFVLAAMVLILGATAFLWIERRGFRLKDLIPVAGLMIFTILAYLLFTRVLNVAVP